MPAKVKGLQRLPSYAYDQTNRKKNRGTEEDEEGEGILSGTPCEYSGTP